jgi:hypothetical protein
MLGSADQGEVVKGNVGDLVLTRTPLGAPLAGRQIFRATSAVSDATITYTYTIKAEIPEGAAAPAECVENYQVYDGTTTDTSNPVHLLKDAGVINVNRVVIVN